MRWRGLDRIVQQRQVDVGNFKLHDDKGKTDEKTFTVPAGTKIGGEGFLLYCKNSTGFAFGIGKTDTVSLVSTSGNVLDTTGKMPGGFAEDRTFARVKDGEGGTDGTGFEVRRKPSPGATNKKMLPAKLQVFINEIADKGTGKATCDDEDWIELYNAESDAVNLTGWTLHDDKGKTHEDAYVHKANHTSVTIASGGFLVLCGEKDFKFGVGSDGTISLLDQDGTVIDTTGKLEKRGNNVTVFGRTEDGAGIFTYLTPPSPGKTNKGMKYKPPGDAPAIAPPGSTTIALNEIADKGSGDSTCNGEDWVELHNYGSKPVDIGKWHLVDEKGVLHADVHIFPDDKSHVIQPQGFMLLCKVTNFKFGIGGTDTVTLLNDKKQQVDTVVLTGQGSVTKTIQRKKFDGTGDWMYSEDPSPGKSNCKGGCPINPAFTTAAPSKSSDRDNTGVIAGAVIGSIVGIAAIAFVVHKVMREKTPPEPTQPTSGFIKIDVKGKTYREGAPSGVTSTEV